MASSTDSKNPVIGFVLKPENRKPFLVEKWVPDVHLEKTLNKMAAKGYGPYKMYRNPAVNGTPETTTIVFALAGAE